MLLSRVPAERVKTAVVMGYLKYLRKELKHRVLIGDFKYLRKVVPCTDSLIKNMTSSIK